MTPLTRPLWSDLDPDVRMAADASDLLDAVAGLWPAWAWMLLPRARCGCAWCEGVEVLCAVAIGGLET